ncbi:hypothetical protein JOB18_015060 [Solea senegalensis]|uniref:Uncharacterized protein n=1 Tax=Solea senegalensis TaxID=28829 RepID=A0AAV6PD32_SOLSE|nr:hypothetical protein JOB18_015060 [Solea senegalensis]
MDKDEGKLQNQDRDENRRTTEPWIEVKINFRTKDRDEGKTSEPWTKMKVNFRTMDRGEDKLQNHDRGEGKLQNPG